MSIVVDVGASVLSTAPGVNYVSIMSTHLDWSIAQYLDWSAARYLSPVQLFGALVAGVSWYIIDSARRYIRYVLPVIGLCYATPFVAQMLQPVAEGPQAVMDFLKRGILRRATDPIGALAF